MVGDQVFWDDFWDGTWKLVNALRIIVWCCSSSKGWIRWFAIDFAKKYKVIQKFGKEEWGRINQLEIEMSVDETKATVPPPNTRILTGAPEISEIDDFVKQQKVLRNEKTFCFYFWGVFELNMNTCWLLHRNFNLCKFLTCFQKHQKIHPKIFKFCDFSYPPNFGCPFLF